VARGVSAYVSAPQTEDFFRSAEVLKEVKLPSDLEEFDFVVVVGDDLTSTAPVLTYRLKKPLYRVGRVDRDAKLKPKTLELKDLQSLEGRGAVIVTPHGVEDPEETVRQLSELCSQKGWEIFLLPKETNTLALYELLKEDYSHLYALLEKVKAGEIKNLIVFGEELKEFLGEEELEELLGKLEHLVVVSPFKEGLAQKAVLAIPMNLFGEVEGTYLTCEGEKRAKRVLPWGFEELEFWSELARELGGEGKAPRLLGEERKRLRFAHLYRNGWITERSAHLTKLYEKNAGARV